MCIFMYIYIHIYIYVYTCVHTNAYIYICVCVCVLFSILPLMDATFIDRFCGLFLCFCQRYNLVFFQE